MKASPVATEEPTAVEVSAKAPPAARGEGGRHQSVGPSEPRRKGRTMRARLNSDGDDHAVVGVDDPGTS